MDAVPSSSNGPPAAGDNDTAIVFRTLLNDSTLVLEKKAAVDNVTSEATISDESTVPTASSENTEKRFEALATERAALRDEVAHLRKSLKEMQEKHQEELSLQREQLEESIGDKERAETQYSNLLGKVNTIRSQLGEKLKADAVSTFSVAVVCSLNDSPWTRRNFLRHGVVSKN